MNSYIGRGEVRVKLIIELLLGVHVYQQVHIKEVVTEVEFFNMSESYQKRKFDLQFLSQSKHYMLEVNYKHKTKAAIKWEVLKPFLIANNFTPITIEDENCPYLFKEPHTTQWIDYIEVIQELSRQEVRPKWLNA